MEGMGVYKWSDGRIYKGAIKSADQQIPHGHGFMCLNRTDIDVESETFGKKLTVCDSTCFCTYLQTHSDEVGDCYDRVCT